jgi:diadenosine tetraphosphate (Ap4A) HIT family hydrolase
MDASPPDCPLCEKIVSLEGCASDDVVWQFPHSVAFLGPWQYYVGYCILVCRRHARELHELSESERRAYLEEMCLLAQAIHRCFEPDKLNYELLGNQVPHLHWHLFPRYRHDPNARHPVWLELDQAERDETARQRLQTGPLDRATVAARLREHFQIEA